MNQNTGGPAFPQPNHLIDTDHGREEARGWMADSGMTLLDWMAGQALAGLLASGKYDPCLNTGAVAYDQASAMLAEKARREATGKQDLQVDDHFRDATKMIPDHSPDAGKMAKLEALNRELAWALDTMMSGWVDPYDDNDNVAKARAILAKSKEVA